ncbi:hypothetical protein HPP92_016749 [Vanilla planifolia]|uniref:Uncharacterized protein n=1 Tax=Vanilla planifolia TaxID=51239 RepID=A0A835UNR6_VANPL|nr:hypothetical protein HPP92_016749 [Vanilla planifolia]
MVEATRDRGRDNHALFRSESRKVSTSLSPSEAEEEEEEEEKVVLQNTQYFAISSSHGNYLRQRQQKLETTTEELAPLPEFVEG